MTDGYCEVRELDCGRGIGASYPEGKGRLAGSTLGAAGTWRVRWKVKPSTAHPARAAAGGRFPVGRRSDGPRMCDDGGTGAKSLKTEPLT